MFAARGQARAAGRARLTRISAALLLLTTLLLTVSLTQAAASPTIAAKRAEAKQVALEIQDDSAAHVGHAGAASGAGHFSLLIVSEAFNGVPRLKRHQTVMARVADLLPHPIHALSIRALAPEEYF